MFKDRLFAAALLISVLAHGIILTQHGFSIPSRERNIKQEVKINYFKKPPEYKPEAKKIVPKKTISEPFLELNSKVTAERKPPPRYARENPAPPGAPKPPMPLANLVDKPSLALQPQVVAVKDKASLPAVAEADKIDNPSVVSYYQIVREKIRRAAFRNYSGKELGEVTMSFIISSDGYLQKIFLMEDSSSASAYLRGIAVDSIKSASPFPQFPKELNYTCLLFRLPIEFESE